MWNKQTLHSIVETDDLKVAPQRQNGECGTPTWIWCVQVNGELYVRAYSGVRSSWYQSAIQQQKGRIQAAGKTFDVHFEAVESTINNAIDQAYRKKYTNSRYLSSMLSERARAATVCISPIT